MLGAHSPARRAHAARLLVGTVAVSVAAGLFAGCGSSGQTPVASTVPVERATISTGVSGAGTVAASSSRNLGFAAGGRLASVKVRVGDKVTAGQVLARLDTFQLKQIVVQQKANLSSQQAALARLRNNPSLTGSRSTLTQARTIADATRSQVAATKRADEVSIKRSRAAVSAAQDALDAAQAALAACAADCTGLQSAVATAQASVVSAQTALATAEQRKKVDAAAGTVSVAGAKQGVVAAQNSANSTASDRPYGIAQQEAAVTTAQSLVEVAEHNLSEATLEAPISGTITAINGVVGEYLSASSGTTAQAPGSAAAVPGTTVVAGASSVTRAGGTQFMVISGDGPMTAVVPLTELDAANVEKGQAADLSFDALPDVTGSGKVTAIAPSGTALAGSMSFYVTISLGHPDGRVKEGMSVHAAVTTQEHDDVLSVPNAAVRNEDGHQVVTVVDGTGKQQTVAFTAGLVGTERTEVVSGLSEGDQVVVPGPVH
ncbi:MAG: HlyD family efflux transporter periplasmic adaptor subunit [Micropruina sp.]|uniref:efflux RND transporter periplasmic adaptor subunit n=1 Tax=Micropruina sp. TaxID=2737536 RepID=UPI0039E5F91B